MKLNFSILMFFLIVGMPFFLFEEKKEKKGKIEFLQKKEDFKERDTIQLFEIIEGKEEEYLLGFLKNERAYFYNDTIELNLVAGLLDGYILEIKIIGNEFKGKLRNYSCTWSRDLAIKKLSLIFENFKLVNGNKLKGEVYCETNRLYSFQNGYVERVKIKGYFEMELFGVNKKDFF